MDSGQHPWPAPVDVRLALVAGPGDQGKALAMVQEVLDRKPLGPAHADLLARGTGVRAPFWLEYERIYRAGLAAGLIDVSEPAEGSPS